MGYDAAPITGTTPSQRHLPIWGSRPWPMTCVKDDDAPDPTSVIDDPSASRKPIYIGIYVDNFFTWWILKKRDVSSEN